jgi:hypothetical protein
MNLATLNVVAEEGGFVFDTISILADPDGPRASERRSVICNAGTTIGPFFNRRSQESRSICWAHANPERDERLAIGTHLKAAGSGPHRDRPHEGGTHCWRSSKLTSVAH